MSLNRELKERVYSAEPGARGAFIALTDPASVEIMAGSGAEVVCIDAEHGPTDVGEIQNLIRAANAAGVASLVRVPAGHEFISRVLDLGAAGVVVPRTETAEQASVAVEYALYPPRGRRGAGPARASLHGLDLYPYVSRAHDETLVVIQIETAAGVANALEIARLDGVDMVFIGPGDLAVSLGVELGDSEHTRAIETIASAATEAGKPFGIFAGDVRTQHMWLDRGARLVIAGADRGMLAAGAKAHFGGS